MVRSIYTGYRALFFVLAILLSGCAGKAHVDAEVGERKKEFSYFLGRGDVLRVYVYGERDLSGQFVVGEQGEVNFPLIGSVVAEGKSVKGFEADLRTSLSKGFLKNPKVTIEVLNYRPYYISGAISKTNKFPYKAGMTLLDAVVVAGGYTARANKNLVYIRSAGDNVDKAYDLSDGDNIYIYPGDNITIPESFL